MFKDIFRLGLFLLIVTAVSALLLAVIFNVTDPQIKENARKTEEEARLEVLPQAQTFQRRAFAKEDGDSVVVYCGYQNEKLVGYTFIASQYGYSSEIKTMVGITPEFQIQGIKVLFQQETPGLGANCEAVESNVTLWQTLSGNAPAETSVAKPKFQQQFEGLTMDKLLVDKDGGTITSMTGATITSRTITESIRFQMEKLKSVLEGAAL